MLINCPECNQSVSTYAATCPHCGYPMKDACSDTSKIDTHKTIWFTYLGETYDITQIVRDAFAGEIPSAFGELVRLIICDLTNKKLITPKNADEESVYVDDIINKICAQTGCPNFDPAKDYKQPNRQQPKPVEDHRPKCPTCGSTNLTKLSSATRFLDGLVFGRHSVQGRAQFWCRDCNYRW